MLGNGDFLFSIGVNTFIKRSHATNRAGKKVFVNRSLCFAKTYLQGYNKRLKKISTPALRLGSIFFAALDKYRRHTPPLRSNSLRYASLGARGGRAVLFCCTRSLNPHSQLHLPPETPIRCSQNSHGYKTGGKRRL